MPAPQRVHEMATVWMFAGQGAEEPGMGLALAARSAEARAWLDAASRVTGIDVPRALDRGAKALGRTSVLQPVLVAVGLASAASSIEARHPPEHVTGHSLGELTAACWAASVPMIEALELASLRGRLMEELAEAKPGGMAAVTRVEAPELERLLEGADGVLGVAAMNTPDEVVVSGDREALSWLSEKLAGRCRALRVSWPWHSERMRPAVRPYRARLEEVLRGRTLRARVWSTTRASELSAEELPAALADGLVQPVRFLDTITELSAAGIDRALLPAPSRTTRSLLRRAGARVWAIDDP